MTDPVMPRDTYARVNAHDSYGEYLYERVSQIVATYGARSVVPIVPSDHGWLTIHLAVSNPSFGSSRIGTQCPSDS